MKVIRYAGKSRYVRHNGCSGYFKDQAETEKQDIPQTPIV